MKTLEQNNEQVVDLVDQEKSGNWLTLAQYFGMAGSGAADSGSDNVYTNAGDSNVNVYKQLSSPDGALFFDDVDHFRLHFLSNIDKYASPDINEKDKNRRAFFEFSAYMLYSAVNADENLKEEKKKPLETVLSVFKRREIVQFDAKRKRFLNKMIKSNDPWSDANLSVLLGQYNWQEAFVAYQNLKEEYQTSKTENDYSKSSELFAREDRDDDDAIYYSKEDYKNESEWYYLGQRNQMTRKEQFVQEQQLYGEFCLYLSLKQQLYENSDPASLNELNENAQKFVDKMYGDGLNENFWGQAKYFRLLNKYFPDYSDYLTEQRDIIKKGLNSVMDDLLNSIGAFVKRLKDFLAGVDESQSQLMQLSVELPAIRAKIASTKLSTAAILSEFGPEHKKSFELGLDALSASMNEVESLIIEKQHSLVDHEAQKKEGLVVLQQLIETIHNEKTALQGSHLITDVEPFISVVARLYTKFHAAEEELKIGLKLHEEIDEFDRKQREKIRETKEEAVAFDNKAFEIELAERQRRSKEIADARVKFSQLMANGMKESDKAYYLSYDGSPEKKYNESYWDALVEKYTETNDDIRVVQFVYGDVKISKAVTNTFVDFLFGIIDVKKFDEQIAKYTQQGDNISSVYSVMDHIEKIGMAGISEKFSGDTKEIYETETPQYYTGVIKAKAHILSMKPTISEKFMSWQKSTKKGIENRNYHNVEYAKEKRRGQVIFNWFSEYKSGTKHRDELACDITPYLETNEFDVRSGIASIPLVKQGDLIDAILDKIAANGEDLSHIHGGLLLFFHDRLEASGVASKNASNLKKHLESTGWISSDDKMNHLRFSAMDRAMDFIEKNPNKSKSLYGFAGAHKGVPGKPIDCSGMVSQCVQYVGSDYLNSSPEIYGKRIGWLNGVGNVINQPNVWRILPEEVQPGDLVTMSDRRKYHEIETGHIAFIYEVKRSVTGEITELVIRHSSGGKGPNVQTVDLTKSTDSYAKYFPSFRYWRFGDPDYQIPEDEKCEVSEKSKGKEPVNTNKTSQGQYTRPTGKAEFTLGVKYSPEEFKKTFGPIIIQETEGTTLFPSVKLAQMALETGWGEHTAGEGKNLYGIKATGKPNEYWNGDYVTKSTGEHYNGKDGVYQKKFRKYETYEDCIKDHSRLLLTADHYKKAREATTPEEQAKAIHDGGYATSPTYTKDLIFIINKYGFKDLDKGFADSNKSNTQTVGTGGNWDFNEWMKNVEMPDNPSDYLTTERFSPIVDEWALDNFFTSFKQHVLNGGNAGLEVKPKKLIEFDKVPAAFKKQYGISGNVGKNGNKSADVKTVQKLMSMMGYSMSRSSELNVERDGKKGALFMSTIYHFQSVHGLTGNMTVSPNEDTWKMMIRVAYSNAERLGENVNIDDPVNIEKVAKALWQERRIDKKDIPKELIPNISHESKTSLAVDSFGYMVPAAFHKRLARLATCLGHIEKAVKDNGGEGIRIESGYRSPEKNASLEKQKSAENSNHIIGQAADIVCLKRFSTDKKKHLEKFHNIIMDLINEGKIDLGAIATYWNSNNAFIHYDIRGEYKNWQGKNGMSLTEYNG